MGNDNKVTPAPILRKVVVAGDFAFVSGQGPKDPATGEIVSAEAAAQTVQSLRNIAEALESVGAHVTDIVRATVYLTDARHYPEINAAYREFFPTDPPARTSLVVAALANPAYLVEIDAVAYRVEGADRS